MILVRFHLVKPQEKGDKSFGSSKVLVVTSGANNQLNYAELI